MAAIVVQKPMMIRNRRQPGVPRRAADSGIIAQQLPTYSL